MTSSAPQPLPRRSGSPADPDVHYLLESSLRSLSPLVSVVVTTKDHAGHLPDALVAIEAQDLQGELEIIVCDNASADATESIMRARVESARRPLTYVRLMRDVGPARSRNVGIAMARGTFVAFTDADCVPTPDWLRVGLTAFADPAVGVVQGRTVPTDSRVPLFEHHIAIERFDGTFATANVIYRREAINGLRFDPACAYWEDVDLGWRVIAKGWTGEFMSDAVVGHKVIRLSAPRWIFWPIHYKSIPAIVRNHPGFRRHLFLRVWMQPIHMLFDLAVVGAIAALWWRPALLSIVPYLVAFFGSRGIRGRFPPAKAIAHLAWDVVAFVTLASASARYRALVL
ncbi:MAG TPA: glycosyltransferase [Candidatus Dormibacteraeota bacterium]|nr:glycosyltransferase [Candidatus Dormibacteraeota bacterium]